MRVDEEDLAAFSHHVYVDMTHRFVFFTIPKVACTEWIRLFMRLRGEDDWRDNPHYREGRPFLSHLPAEQCTRIFNSPAWVKAIFFRDPVERLLSCYLDKFVYFKSYQVELFGERGRDVTFEEFLSFVFHPNTNPSFPQGLHRGTNPHWRPQTLIGNFYKFKEYFDFIGDFSRLQEHAKCLLEHLGLWREFGASGWGMDGQGAMFGANTAEHRTGARDKIEMYFTEGQRIQAEQVYRDDYAVINQIGSSSWPIGSMSRPSFQ